MALGYDNFHNNHQEIKNSRKGFKKGISAGIIWIIISIVLDLLLFIWGPMKMTFLAYISDIGLTYFTIPIITRGMGTLIERKRELKRLSFCSGGDIN